MQDNTNKRTSSGGIFLFTVIWSSILIIYTIFIISRIYGIQFFSLIKYIALSLYFPHYNIFPIRPIFAINIMRVVFLLLFVLLISAVFLYIILRIFVYKSLKISYLKNIIITAAFTFFFFFTTIQSIGLIYNFSFYKNILSNKTVAEKQMILFGQLGADLVTCQNIIEGKHQGELFYDINNADDIGISQRSLISYMLYPKVSLRFDNGSKKDYIVYFMRKDNPKDLPDGYKIVYSGPFNIFILAKKAE